MTLKAVKPGTRVIVQKLTGCGRVKRRLMDMGIIPGTEMEVQKIAPLGDPVEIKFKGYNLSLRREEADMIIVETLSHQKISLINHHPRRRYWRRFGRHRLFGRRHRFGRS
jgi:Fe2+ transport system protein FeoA